MATRLTRASSQDFSRTDALDYNDDYTIGGWVKLLQVDAFQGFTCMMATDFNNTDFIFLYAGGGGDQNKIQMSCNYSGSTLFNVWGTTVLAINTTYFIVMQREGDTMHLYLGTTPSNIALEVSGVGDVVGRNASNNFKIGNSPFGDFLNGEVSGWFAIQQTLTLDEIKNRATMLLKQGNEWGTWPLVLPTDLADRSGNGRTLTAAGTPTPAHQPSAIPNYLWLPISGAPPISPAFDGGWEDTEDADRVWGFRNKGSSTITTKSHDEAVTTNPIDVLARQYVFGPFLRSGTWDGSIIGVIRCAEGSSSANAQPQMLAKIVSSDGGTVRGTLVAHQSGTSDEYVLTTLTSRFFPKGATTGLAMSPVAYFKGDYLVLELGTRDVEANSTNRVLSHSYGESGASPLDFSTSDTGVDNPFFMPSFPLDLAFGPSPPPPMIGQAVKRAAFY